MVRVEMVKWGQTLEDLRLASVQAAHRRSREPSKRLYLIASGRFNATTFPPISAGRTRPSSAGSTATTSMAPTP